MRAFCVLGISSTFWGGIARTTATARVFQPQADSQKPSSTFAHTVVKKRAGFQRDSHSYCVAVGCGKYFSKRSIMIQMSCESHPARDRTAPPHERHTGLDCLSARCMRAFLPCWYCCSLRRVGPHQPTGLPSTCTCSYVSVA